MCDPEELASVVVGWGAGEVALLAALVAVPVLEDCSLEAEEEGENDVLPELAIAAFLKASAVWSPDNGGFMERTIPDLQSVPTEEKNLRE